MIKREWYLSSKRKKIDVIDVLTEKVNADSLNSRVKKCWDA